MVGFWFDIIILSDKATCIWLLNNSTEHNFNKPLQMMKCFIVWDGEVFHGLHYMVFLEQMMKPPIVSDHGASDSLDHR